MKNNIVVKLMQLKKSFIDSATNQVDLVGSISELTQQEGSIPTQTVNTGDGKPYIISTINQSGVKRLLIETWSDFSSTDDRPDVSKYIQIGDDGVNLDTYIDGLGKNMYSLLSDVKETGDTNTVIGEICGMFQTTQSVSTQSIIEYIDSTIGSNSQSINELRQLILTNGPEGKLSQYKFLSLLKAIFSSGKSQLENGSLVMNTSGAYFIKNAIGTILLSAVQLIGSILSTILSMVSVVLGVIIAALSNIFQIMGQIIGGAVRTDISVNKDSSLNIFNAPLFYVSDNGLDDHGRVQYVKGLTDKEARLYVRGPLCTYAWNNPEYNGGLMANGFFSLAVHPGRASAFISSRFNFSYNDDTKLLTFTGVGTDEYPDSIYLTTEETYELYCMPNEDLLNLAFFNRLFLSLNRIHTNGTYGSITCNMSGINELLDLSTSGSDVIEKYHNMLDAEFGMLLIFALAISRGGTVADCRELFGIQITGDMMTKWAIDVQQGEYHMSGRELYETIYYHYGREQVYHHNSAHINLNLTASPSILGGLMSQSGIEVSYGYDPECSVTEIPTDGMFSFPNVTWNDVLWAVAIMGLVTTATIVAVAVGKTAYKKWSTKKQLNQYSKLMEARSAYIDSDGNIVGGNAEYKAFYKQIKKYNKWGRLLGYGTYDPTNNWTNAIESDIPDAGFSSELATSALDKVTEDGQLSLGSVVGNSSPIPSLSELHKIITGR